MLQDWEKTPGHMTALDLKVGSQQLLCTWARLALVEGASDQPLFPHS
jgi:hypothetical protein